MSGVNYYQLLGIHATATDGEIRRAYRTLILQYHPDKRLQHPDADASKLDKLCRSIQEAYETLSCPEKRCLYDFVGSFAALAEVTSSCPVPMPAGGSQRRSAVAPDSAGGLWSRSSSGETLHSWGTSSLAYASRLSPCLSSDTHLSSSPGGATAFSGSGPNHRVCSLATASGDPATATSGGGGSGGQTTTTATTTCGANRLAAHEPAAAASALPPEYPIPPPPHGDHSQNQPGPHHHTHHHTPEQHHHTHEQQQQTTQDRRPVFPPELKLPNPAEASGAATSPRTAGTRTTSIAAAAGGGGGGGSDGSSIASSISSPIASPISTLLGKRRSPGTHDPQLQPHDHLFMRQQQPQSPVQPLQQPQSAQPLQPHPQDAAGGSMHTSMKATRAGAAGQGAGGAAAAGGSAGGRRSASSADVYHRLLLTLEELYGGCVKQLRLARRVYRPVGEASSSPPGAQLLLGPEYDIPQRQHLQPDSDPGSPSSCCWCVEELFRVVVAPGWREGTKVTFPGKGDELPCGSRGDMVLVVAQAAHGRYERRGNDLHTLVVVPLVEALTGGPTALTTLDGRQLVLQLGPACLQPFSELVIKGEGMPVQPGKARGARAAAAAAAAGAATAAVAGGGPTDTPVAAVGGGGVGSSGGAGLMPVQAVGARGDLHVRFEVSFPADLTSEQKAELRQALLL